MDDKNAVLVKSYTTTILNIVRYFDDEERNKMLEELSDIVEKSCFLHKKYNLINEVSEKIISDYSKDADEEEIDEKEVYEKYETEIANIKPDVSNHKNFIEFKRQIELLKLGKSNNCTTADNDLIVTEEDINIIDPFTKVRMEDPVRNICGHVYDRASVTAVVTKNKKTRCPISGCKSKNYINLSSLTSDVVVKAYLLKNPT